MNTMWKLVLGVVGLVFAAQAAAQITFYEGENFRGRSFSATQTVWDFQPTGFNDRAQSAVVDGGSWQVCVDARFEGRCVVLRPGSYPSLGGDGHEQEHLLGATGRLGCTLREPGPRAVHARRRTTPIAQRPDEPLFEAPVTSVHAVMGPPEQRCWVEQQQVVNNSGPNVGGAIIGGILGGVLGHQIGGGVGRDVATAGGAVAGAAVGANVGRSGPTVSDQDVRHCETVPNQGPPAFWDVTYNFQGVEHRVQLSAPAWPDDHRQRQRRAARVTGARSAGDWPEHRRDRAGGRPQLAAAPCTLSGPPSAESARSKWHSSANPRSPCG